MFSNLHDHRYEDLMQFNAVIGSSINIFRGLHFILYIIMVVENNSYIFSLYLFPI